MKTFGKGVIWAAAAALAFTLTACGGSGGDNTPAPETQAQTQQAETERQTGAAPETSAPETSIPETAAPETQAPETLTDAPAGGSTEDGVIPADAAGYYVFSSGAGGWSTELTLNTDGSFEGNFHDSDLGDTGEAYPNGTIYFSEFHGRFGNVRRTDETTWSMTLEDLTVTSGFDYEAYIEDQVRWVPSGAYGLEGEPGTTFYLYSPDHPAAGLGEEFLMWIGPWQYADPQPAGLGVYAIHNTTGDYGFYHEQVQ